MAWAGTIKLKGDLIIGVGEFYTLDTEISITDSEITVSSIPAGGSTTQQVSATSILFQTDSPLNIDLLGGNPQTNVKFLLMLAE